MKYVNDSYSGDLLEMQRRQQKERMAGKQKDANNKNSQQPVIFRSSAERDYGMIHVVQPGESLWEIAVDHGTTVDKLLMLNPRYRNNPALIHSGERVRLQAGAEMEGMTTGDELSIKGGKIVIDDFTSEAERYSSEESSRSLNIAIRFIPDPESALMSVENLGWFQTYRTNAEMYSNEIPPTDTAIKDYVDGTGSKDKQEAGYCDRGSFSSIDSLHRTTLSDRDVFWQAETSVIDKSGAKPVRLFTVTWGLKMDRIGGSSVIPLKAIEQPGAYHTAKIGELPSN